MKKKKFLLTLIIFIFTAFSAYSQGINYQAAARNTSGGIIANQLVGVRFSIHTPKATDPAVYEETDTATTNEFGLFTAIVGKGTVVSGIFADINWNSGNMFLQVELDSTGGTNYVDMGTSQLQSVPYALNASSSAQWITNGSDVINVNTGGTVGVNGVLHVANSVAGLGGFRPGNNAIIENTGPSTGASFELLNNSDSSYIEFSAIDSLLWLTSKNGWANLEAGAITGVGQLNIACSTSGYGFYGAQDNVTITNNGTTGAAGLKFINSYNNSYVQLAGADSTLILYGNGTSNTYAGISAGQVVSEYANPNTNYSSNNLLIVNTNSKTEVALTLENAAASSGLQLIGGDNSELGLITLTGSYAAINAGQYNNLSDITMKKDVRYLQNNDFTTCLDQIRNIESIRFRYNSESETEQPGMIYRPNLHLGFVAQSLPVEVTTPMEDPKTHEPKMGFALGDMEGLLLAGVKALDNNQVEMQNKIAAQQKEIEDLKSLIHSLNNKIGNK